MIFASALAAGQSSSFTFQGKLNDGGMPASGTYEMQFRLTDSLGTQVGPTFTNSNVTVAGGIFTVRLTFGSLAFNGDPRFLEISVRPSGSSDPFTTLSPPQSVLSSPYAVRAMTAATADLSTNATNAVNATNALTATTAMNSTQLGGISASQYVLTDDVRLTDDRNPLPNSSNYVQNTTTAQTGNFNISGTGRANVFSSTSQYLVGNSRLIGITGTDSIFAGIDSGLSSSGSGNAFFGSSSGLSTTTGANNAFFGYLAGRNTTASSNNSFFGAMSGQNTNLGANNAFFGYNAGATNNSGSFNTFVGSNAGGGNVGATNNTFIGANSGTGNLTSAGNTYIGAFSNGGAVVTNSSAIGQFAYVGQSNSMVLGSINGVNGATSDTNIGIGTTTPSTKFQVAGTSSFLGNVGIGTSTPTYKFQVLNNSSSIPVKIASNSTGGAGIELEQTGETAWQMVNENGVLLFKVPNESVPLFNLVRWPGNVDPELQGSAKVNGEFIVARLTLYDLLADGSTTACFSNPGPVATLSRCSSSIRFKKDVQPFSSGLSVLKRLNPVTFRWKSSNNLDVGFIAEEVATVEPLLATFDQDGVVEGVKYDRISAVLVNAVKEQQKQIDEQKKQIDELKAMLCSMKPDAPFCAEIK